MKLNLKWQGFVLMEVAIALVILSLMVGFSLPIYNQYIKHQKIKKTDENIELITQALAGYVLQNGTLPCPSKPTTNVDHQGQPSEGCVLENFSSGLVPFKILGIKSSDAKDAWGRWINYTVDLDLILSSIEIAGHSNITDGLCSIDKTSSGINILGEFKQSLLRQTPKRFVAFVLISHGPSGGGALLDNGTIIPTSDSDKQINASRSNQYIDKSIGQTFDDRVRWITRDQFIIQYTKNACQHER